MNHFRPTIVSRSVITVALACAVSLSSALLAAPSRAQCVDDVQTLQPSGAGVVGASAFDGTGSLLALGGSSAGNALIYVFELQSGAWVESATVLPNDPQAGSLFGSRVALSSDGLTLLTSAIDQSEGAPHSGCAYVFFRIGTAWIQETKLLASDPGFNDNLGSSLALSGDGNTAFLGSANKNSNQGAVYVFVRTTNGWTQEAKLVPAEIQQQDRFGQSLAVSLDGNRALISAPDDNHGDIGGTAFLLERSGNTWSLTQKFTHATTSTSDRFGFAVALTDDGQSAWISAPNQGTFLNEPGRVYVHQEILGTWSEVAQIVAPDGNDGDGFGSQITLDADGSDAWIGAAGEDTAFQNDGAIYVYQGGIPSWSLQAKLVSPAPQPFAGFGYSNLVPDASRAVVTSVGSAYTWDVGTPSIHFYCTSKVNSQGCTPLVSTTGTPSASTGSGFFITAGQLLNNKTGLFFYSTVGSQQIPFQGGWLCLKTPVVRTALANTGGNPPPNDCSGSMSFEFNAYVATGADPALVAGEVVYGQFWSRDPGFVPPNNTSLTSAVRFALCE